MHKRTIIIDDERLARNELKKLLQEYPEIEVIDEAANAEEGIKKMPAVQNCAAVRLAAILPSA